MALENYCAACTYLGETCNYNGKFWCEKKGEERFACDPRCSSFCEAYSRSNGTRDNMFDNSKSHQSSGCYITTIICDILNMPDNCYHLNKLRELRDRMQKNIGDLPLLLMYDQIGPQIATCLKNDKDNGLIFAEKAFTNYIDPAVKAIEVANDNKAKDIYILMTKRFADYYGINTNIIIPKEINQKELGHGKVKIKKPQTI